MESIIQFFRNQRYKLAITGALFVMFMLLSFAWAGQVRADSTDTARNGRLVTIHDRGNERVILTHAQSVRDALNDARIAVTPQDVIEPELDKQLLTTSYTVNIYRARPIVVVDGAVRQKIMTAAQTPNSIATAAAIPHLRSEDKTALAVNSDIAQDGASTVLTITRATPLTLQLYGKPTKVYSHAATVGEMLQQKGITLAPQDVVSVKQTTPLATNMVVAIWRNGAQTVTIEEPIAFTTRKVLDTDQPLGYRKIQTPGKNGLKSVTYEITAHNGRETGRKIIQSIALEQPNQQVEIIGAKPGPNALTRAKGAQQYTDSKGVTHRETYYDLNMNGVMGACGGGGYTVRADGAKVDKDGYILIAANLGNYPRCSLVETSMGIGRVYDTGGFAVRHPHGFDLATDWSNGDGR